MYIILVLLKRIDYNEELVPFAVSLTVSILKSKPYKIYLFTATEHYFLKFVLIGMLSNINFYNIVVSNRTILSFP